MIEFQFKSIIILLIIKIIDHCFLISQSILLKIILNFSLFNLTKKQTVPQKNNKTFSIRNFKLFTK